MTLVALVALLAYAVLCAFVLLVGGRTARAVRAADASWPDTGTGDLPTGGTLARQLLAERGLDAVQVVAADVDAYRAVSRELQLADGRIDRASVAAWAIAAHEVGHAAQHRDGDRAWARWWVLSGHTVWASVALPALLVASAATGSAIPLVLAAPCALVLAACWALSRRVEATATATARGLLAGGAIPADAVPAADALLRRTAAGYAAESLVDTGLIDRVAGPWRGDGASVRASG